MGKRSWHLTEMREGFVVISSCELFFKGNRISISWVKAKAKKEGFHTKEHSISFSVTNTNFQTCSSIFLPALVLEP